MGRISNDINSDSIYDCHLNNEAQNQPEIIKSAEKSSTEAANIAENISANQNKPNDVDENKQKNNTVNRNSVHVSNTKTLAFILGGSMVKDVDRHLLTGSINRKYIVKVPPFSSGKTTDMKGYVKPVKRDFIPSLYIH